MRFYVLLLMQYTRQIPCQNAKVVLFCIFCIKLFCPIYKIGIFAVTLKNMIMYNLSVVSVIVGVVVVGPAR
jgi:hypothetical protein